MFTLNGSLVFDNVIGARRRAPLRTHGPHGFARRRSRCAVPVQPKYGAGHSRGSWGRSRVEGVGRGTKRRGDHRHQTVQTEKKSPSTNGFCGKKSLLTTVHRGGASPLPIATRGFDLNPTLSAGGGLRWVALQTSPFNPNGVAESFSNSFRVEMEVFPPGPNVVAGAATLG